MKLFFSSLFMIALLPLAGCGNNSNKTVAFVDSTQALTDQQMGKFRSGAGEEIDLQKVGSQIRIKHQLSFQVQAQISFEKAALSDSNYSAILTIPAFGDAPVRNETLSGIYSKEKLKDILQATTVDLDCRYGREGQVTKLQYLPEINKKKNSYSETEAAFDSTWPGARFFLMTDLRTLSLMRGTLVDNESNKVFAQNSDFRADLVQVIGHLCPSSISQYVYVGYQDAAGIFPLQRFSNTELKVLWSHADHTSQKPVPYSAERDTLFERIP